MTGQLEDPGQRFGEMDHLGSGGFGEVYSAWDKVRGERVAVKFLHDPDANGILRFKREFRALAALSHENLAQLFELISDGEKWLFTMELVPGKDFIAFCCGTGTPDYDRIRLATVGLSRALIALHQSGRVHRDIKPQNVLVTDQGRAVVLDFGMVAELARTDKPEGKVQGTPQYMAPEQVTGGAVGPAADWYSVGVMLFRAMTGRYPISGANVMAMLLRKQREPPPDPAAFGEDAPADLVELTRGLLAPDPDARFDGGQALEILGDSGDPARRRARVRERRVEHFVGRRDELEAIGGELQTAETDRSPRVVTVVGASGMGKSALIEESLRRAEARGAVILSTRCHEHESVPFRAIDGVIDQIANLPASDVPGFADDAAGVAAVRMFGSLGRVFDPPPIDVGADPITFRRRALDAVAGLFEALARTRAVVVAIDDVQWGDLDSADLLRRLLELDDVALLLVFGHRPETRGPLLSSLGELVAGARVDLEPLAAADARELALAAGADEAHADLAVAQGGGTPLFIETIAHAGAGTAQTFEGVMQSRLEELPGAAREVLELIALSGRPVPRDLLRGAAPTTGEFQVHVAQLRNSRLARASDGDLLECYHDRVRQAVVNGLPQTRVVKLHRALAERVLASPAPEAAVVATHLSGAGDERGAARYLRTAGEDALDAFAFQSAEQSFRAALGFEGWDQDERRDLLTKLGASLGAQGRGPEAASAYASAARAGESDLEHFDLRRRAAEQLLRSGYVDQGVDEIYAVARGLGLKPVRNPVSVTAMLLMNQARLSLGAEPRVSEERLSPTALAVMDTCFSAANHLGTVDVQLGLYFQLLNMRLARRSGDPGRIGRALALQGVHAAGQARTRARADALFARARDLTARATDDEVHQSYLRFSEAMAHYMAAEFRPSHQAFAETKTLLGAEGGRFAWEQQLVRVYDLYCLMLLGKYEEYAAELPSMLQWAQDRDDLLQATAVRCWSWFVHLRSADVSTAREELAIAEKAWSGRGVHVQHFWHLQAQVYVELFDGDSKSAYRAIRARWGQMRRGLLLTLQLTRVMLLEMRARTALAVAVDSPEQRKRLLREADRDIRAIEREDLDYARGYAALLRGQVAMVSGDDPSARLAAAQEHFENAGLDTLARISEHLLGRNQEHWFARRGVRDVDRFVQAYSPVHLK